MEKRRGDWKPEGEGVDFSTATSERDCEVRKESVLVSCSHFAGPDNPQSLGLESASTEGSEEVVWFLPWLGLVWCAQSTSSLVLDATLTLALFPPHPPNGGRPRTPSKPSTDWTPLSPFPGARRERERYCWKSGRTDAPEREKSWAGVGAGWRGRREGGLGLRHAVGSCSLVPCPLRARRPSALPVARRGTR